MNAQIAPGWSSGQAFELADRVLSHPPARPLIVRVPGAGLRVARFALPLELCPTGNRYAEARGWMLAKWKRSAASVMRGQALARQEIPHLLSGRPMVRAIRFSPRAPDACADWAKIPVDRLTGKHGGLGWLVDDNPTRIDLRAWWEPSGTRSGGCVLVELWTGEVTQEQRHG